MNNVLQALQLSCARNEHNLFYGLEFELKPGQGLFICGPNGSGKTSLLRMLAGLISPDEGAVLWEGQALRNSRLNYHQALHFVGHQPGVKAKLTVKENLRYSQDLADQSAGEKESVHATMSFPRKRESLALDKQLPAFAGMTQLAKQSREKRLETALRAAQLLPQQNKLAQQLSAGQKRRLGLARLLASPKPLWILDEPFANLDQGSQQWFCEVLEKHLQEQGLVILASHQPFKLKNPYLFQTLYLPYCARGAAKHV